MGVITFVEMIMPKRKHLLLVLIAAVLLLFVWLAPAFRVCRDFAFICENTGSRKGYREWFFGLETGHWYTKSSLEIYMQKNYPAELQNRWTCNAGTGKNIFGASILFGHGRPGYINMLQPAALDSYVATLAAPDKKRLYELFTHGESDALRAKVDEIILGREPE